MNYKIDTTYLFTILHLKLIRYKLFKNKYHQKIDDFIKNECNINNLY